MTTKLYHGGFHRLRNYSKKIAFFTASLSKKNRYKRLSLIAHRERRAHFGQWNRGGPAGQECLCARFMIRRCERYGGCRFLELLTFLQLLVHCCCLLLQHGKAEHYDYNTKWFDSNLLRFRSSTTKFSQCHKSNDGCGLLTITLKIMISCPAFSSMASITTKTNTKQVVSKYETSFCDKY